MMNDRRRLSTLTAISTKKTYSDLKPEEAK